MSRLFLSSTAADLAEFRKVAIHVCQRLGIEVLAMEEFGPDPRAAAAVCQAKIAQADLFLGLYAHRYGHVPDGFEGKSITQLEYEWAVQRNPPLPVLLFLVDEELPWLPKHIDDGEAKKRLHQLKERLRKQHVVSTLTKPEQLMEELFVHLPKFRDQTQATAAPSSVLPAPPEPYVAHQYTLLQTNQVIGREAELRTLDQWLGDPAGEFAVARLLCVVAIGGMGKSALTWKWFHQYAPRVMPSLAGRFWWSFYESDAGFDHFVTAALAYCSARSLEAVAALPAVDREIQLLAILDRHPFLLVLDGLERVLIAYSNLDFAHLVDEELDERTANAVAGARGLPQEAGSSFIGQHRLRKTIDPRAGNFLRKLAHVRAASVLVTTRLYPSELQTVTGHEILGTAAWFLRGLTPADALSLWRAMGVSGSDEELAKLFAAIDHYPLLIRALAGEVARYRRAPGNFDAWRCDHPDFDPFSLPLVQAKSHVLAHALSDLNTNARAVLHTIAAFRAPVAYDTLAALFVQGREWRQEKLDVLLTELEDRGVVGWDRRTNVYDLHPIVRGVVWRGLDQANQREVYESVQQYFSAISDDNKEDDISVEEVLPRIELFTALVGLGRYDDATAIYFERIHQRFNFVITGMEHVNIALLESLFPDGLDHPPRSTDRRGAVLVQLGHAYNTTGRLVDARSFYLRDMRAMAPSDHTRSMVHSFISENALLMGQLREAIAEGEAAIDGDVSSLVDEHIALFAQREATVGNVTKAIARIRALKHTERFDPEYYLAPIYLRMGKCVEAARLAKRNDMPLILAEAWLNLDRVDGVAQMLLDVLREARAMAYVHQELNALRALAEFHRRLGDFDQSRAYLGDLAEPAARGPFRLIQADAANVLAELERDCGNKDAAIAASQDAYRLAWCDGPPYSYLWALEHAKRLLLEFGAPFPGLASSN